MKLQILTSLLLFILDQALKIFLFIPSDSYVVNDAWLTVLMLPFLLSFVVFVYAQRKRFLRRQLGQIAAGLVLGGALSNVFDVAVRGGVVDYVSLFDIIHFNLADVGIVAGLTYMSWSYLRTSR